MITRYWSRAPGKFVDKMTGMSPDLIGSEPQFTGTVREWYDTLVEEIKSLHFDTDRKANAIIVSRDIATILEFTATYQCTTNDNKFSTLKKFGTLKCCKLDVYVDDSLYNSKYSTITFASLHKKKDSHIKRSSIAQLKVIDMHVI